MAVYTDTNADVGAKTPQKSDAPTTSNGYETMLFSAQQYKDPDAAWSRISPQNNKVVQLAFKPDQLDDSKSFVWSVWADDGIKDPAKYDYNDVYKLSEAGSPLENNDNYPVKQVSLLDGTCRTPYNAKLSGREPGAMCQDAPVVHVPTIPPVSPPQIDRTKLPTWP